MCERPEPVAPGLGRRGVLRLIGAGAVLVLARPTRAAPQGAGDVVVAPGLSIRPRAAWGADRPPTGPIPPDDVRFLLVHHTAGNTEHPPGDVPRILRSIYDFHTGPARSWPDVCYHFFVDRYGVVWEGRAGSIDGPVAADATGGNQGYAQLACLIGDFTTVTPTAEAQASLVRLLAWLGARYGIDTRPGAVTQFVSRGSNRWPAGQAVVASTISGHRDMSLTACPGDAFYPILISEVADRVTAVRASQATATSSTRSAATSSGTPPAASSVEAPDGSLPTVDPRPSPSDDHTTQWVIGGAGIAVALGIAVAATFRAGGRRQADDGDREQTA